ATEPRCQIDQRTAPTLDHAGNHRARHVEDPIDVDGKGIAPIVLTDAEQRAEARNARIVDENIERPAAGLQGGDGSPHGGGDRHIARRGGGVAPKRADLGRGRLGRPSVDVEEADVAPSPPQLETDGTANSVGPAGDQRTFSCEPWHGEPPCLLPLAARPATGSRTTAQGPAANTSARSTGTAGS